MLQHHHVDRDLSHLHALFDRLARRRRYNGVVLIAKHGAVLFHRLMGHRDVDGALPLTERSAFNLASVSKQFTAVAILILVEQGRLGLEDRVETWLPELAAPGVRIHHLLHHTSGVADYMELARQHWKDEKTLTFAGLLEMFSLVRPAPRFPSGERYEYSNTGYVLLATIVERASGQPLHHFMRQSIFAPAGMNDSAVFNKLSMPDELPERVFGFGRRFGFFGEKVANDLTHLDGVAGDGGVYASARDLLAWEMALSNRVILSAGSLAAASRSGRTNDGKLTGYGYGWLIEADGQMSHNGAWTGFSSFVLRDPARGVLTLALESGSHPISFASSVARLTDFAATI